MCEGVHGFIPAAGVFQFKVVFNSHGSIMMNNFNILSGAGVAPADMDRIEQKLLDWLTNNWKPNSSNVASCSMIQALHIGEDAGLAKDYAISPTVTGSITTGGFPGNVTVAIKWLTGFGGRSARGRTFHVALAQISTNGNTLSGPGQSALTTAYTALLTKLAAGGTVDKLAIVSYCSNGAWRTNAQVLPVTNMAIETNLDSQRRRLGGRGI